MKIPPPPVAPFLSGPLLNHPLDLVRLEKVLQLSVGVGVQKAPLLLLEYRELMFSGPPLRVRGALLVVFLGSQRRLVPSLQVCTKPYFCLCLPTTSTDVISPPVTTGTSKPANPVFSDKDPSNSQSSKQVGQRNLILCFRSARSR